MSFGIPYLLQQLIPCQNHILPAVYFSEPFGYARYYLR